MSSNLDKWGGPAWAFQTKADAVQDLLGTGSLASVVGTGYSFAGLSVTSNSDSANTRGWRVNVTTSDSISHGDLQSIHGYLTLGSSVTLTAGAAVYPLSAWLEVPADLTTATGNVIAGLRVIFEGNGVDLSALAGGGESALGYFQGWSDSSSIEHGLAIIAGATNTVKNGIHFGPGTYTYFFDFSDLAATQTLFNLGMADATSNAHVQIFKGEQSDSAGVFGEVGACGIGSLYISNAGILFIKSAHTGASTDWISAATGASV